MRKCIAPTVTGLKKGSKHSNVQDLVKFNKTIILFALVGYEIGYGQLAAVGNLPPHIQRALMNYCQIFHYYARFTFTNESGEGMDIAFGSADDNEVLSSGQSATQFPQEYRLETSTSIFHLIDTPGIGDCRGIEKDKENFDNILAFLTCYDKINAVVVLLKPNNARLTVAFKFCVLELLTHLHKSLVSNIMFAFTNSRGTFYRPGDSLPVLKKLLDENSIGIDVSPSNYFCFDNEAFR